MNPKRDEVNYVVQSNEDASSGTEQVWAEFGGRKVEVRYIKNNTYNKELCIPDLYRRSDAKVAQEKNELVKYESLRPQECRDLYSIYSPDEIRASLVSGVGGVGGLRYLIEDGDIVVLTKEEYEKEKAAFEQRKRSLAEGSALERAIEEVMQGDLLQGMTIPSRLDNPYIEELLATLMRMELDNERDAVSGIVPESERVAIVKKYQEKFEKLKELGKEDKAKIEEILRKLALSRLD